MNAPSLSHSQGFVVHCRGSCHQPKKAELSDSGESNAAGFRHPPAAGGSVMDVFSM
jgi:hypothetical protein